MGGADVFFCGDNAQGKTALLEACGLLTALRSFRTTDLKSVIRFEGSGEAQVKIGLVHDEQGDTSVHLNLGKRSRKIQMDGASVERLKDFIGLFPVVAFTSQDIQLLRGGPQLRRRFIDLMLAASQPDYFDCLRYYHHALKERNALLKQGVNGLQLQVFERGLADQGVPLHRMRREAFTDLNTDLQLVYSRFGDVAEKVQINYKPSGRCESMDAYLSHLEETRKRDLMMQTTGVGPHRDDFELKIGGKAAKDFGSEGQQRGLVLALRLAEVRWFRKKLKVAPIILADDVLNELDASRSTAFWENLDDDLQVLATGTRWPSSSRRAGWLKYKVAEGNVSIYTETKMDEN